MLRRYDIREVVCKTILNRGTVGFADYTLNAYQGCAFACSYCYVPAMRSRRGQVDGTPWGGWVEVKTNAPDVLAQQLPRIKPDARIAIGTATDSWQPLEKKYRIARGVLEVLTRFENPVHILSRSPLLIRDIDLLQSLESVKLGVSLPTFDDKVRRAFEPMAPDVRGRMELVKRLVGAGFSVTLFCCPVLPGVADNAAFARDYMRRAADLGVVKVVWDMLGYWQEVAPTHFRLLNNYQSSGHPVQQPRLDKEAFSQEMRKWAEHFGIRERR